MEALWVATSFALGLLGRRLGLPPLVGYLVAGFGLASLGIKATDFLHEIAHLGVLLLLFTVGLKLRLGSLIRPEVLGVGGVHLALFGALVAVGLGFGLWGQTGVVVGLALAFSSTVLAVKILEDKRELKSFHGRVAVGILVLQDLVAVAVLAVLGVQAPSPWAVLLLLFPLLRPMLVLLLKRVGHDELQILYGLGLALIGGQLATMVGLSSELGALLMGALLAGQPQTGELSKSLWSLKEAFLVAFFLEIGLGGLPPVGALPSILLLLLLLPIKWALFFGLFVAFGLRARTAFVASLALSSYSEFALIVAIPMVEAGRLGSEWTTLIGLTVALSLAIAAPLNRNAHQIYDRLERWLHRFERPVLHPDREPTQLGSARWLVVGMGRTGGAVYKLLDASGERVVGLDSDPAKLEHHRAKKRRVLYGDSEDPELWDRLATANLKGVLLTMPEIEAKIRAAQGLRQNGFKGIVAATSFHLEEDPILEQAGVSLIFHPLAEAGEQLGYRALQVHLQAQTS